MSILLLLIPISLIFVGIALWAFLWAVNHDQFDDLDRAAHSILFDDDLASPAARGDGADEVAPIADDRIEPTAAADQRERAARANGTRA